MCALVWAHTQGPPSFRVRKPGHPSQTLPRGGLEGSGICIRRQALAPSSELTP